AGLFPKRKWLTWEGDTENDQDKQKSEAILNLSQSWIQRPEFKLETKKLIDDYVEAGNCFVMPVWEDRRQDSPTGIKEGYAGPIPQRISPTDIVFNPIAPNFQQSPKIIRTLLTIGELKAELDKFTTDDNIEEMTQIFNY